LVAVTGPRGIVLVAVAGLFGERLVAVGIADGAMMALLAFGLVAVTVVLHGFTLTPVARALGLSGGDAPGVLIVGGTSLVTQLGALLRDLDVPVVISDTANLAEAMERIMVGKMLNAGQVCIAPDYVLLPEHKLDEAVSIAKDVVARMYPTLLANEQYTAMVNERHYERMQRNLADANERGIQTITINPANEDFSVNPTHKVPPTLILNPDDDALCMTDEIFGPLLPLKTYTQFEDTISYINAHPRPLAAYYFGKHDAEEHRFLTGTTSGGACVNDVMFHMLQKDLPFGGVGPSGMGAYHGIEGFKTFSHAKSVYKQPGKIPVTKLAGFMPPYGDTSEKSIKQKVRL